MSKPEFPSSNDANLLAVTARLLATVPWNQAVEEALPDIAAAVDAASIWLAVPEGERCLFAGLKAEQYRVIAANDWTAPPWGAIVRERKSVIIRNKHSALCAPLVYEDRVLAILALTHDDPRHFDRHHLGLVTAVAHQLALKLAAVQRVEEQAETLDEAEFKRGLLHLASHDLRSPLALIGTYAEMIALETPESLANIHQYLDEIRHSLERIQSWLDDLLRAEAIRTDPLNLRDTVYPLELIEMVVDDMQAAADEKSQQLDMQIQLDGSENTVVADADVIRGAMNDLVSNAVKYTPEGGRIVIRTYVRDACFHFEVEDNGIGIAPEHLSHLFQPFYRVKPRGAEHIEGTGLGLSTVKTAVERHHGQVWVESEEGVGSRFGFWLPLQPRG